MSDWLVDTGPIVAWLDADDSDHARVARRMNSFSGRLVTSSAVVTESMYFVSATSKGPRRLGVFVADSGMRVFVLAQPTELRKAVDLMERYADTPMDYADATLVLLAEALQIHDILTLDRRGFSSYRVPSRKPFRLVLEQSS